MGFLHGHVSPVSGADAVMQPFGGGFDKSVAERLQQERGVVIVSLFGQFDLAGQSTADGYDEGAGVVGTVLAVLGQYKIRQGKECSFGFLLLLPQARYRRVALG